MFSVTVRTESETYTCSYSGEIRADKILSDIGVFLHMPCGGNGICGKCGIILNGRPALACRTYIKTDSIIDYTGKSGFIQGITYGNMPVFAKDPLVEEGFGAAIDIGTTTIAGYIYTFPACELIKAACVPNPQAAFGADVISRINHYAAGGAEQLKAAVCNAINEITNGFEIKKYVICGNTAMLHLFTGKDPSGIAVAPYYTDHLFGEWISDAYLVRCISPFVGADITAAMLACDMDKHETALLVDIGTNGEMVLKSKAGKLCCSTAAGPCFEGAGISCGIPAVAGAICAVSVKDGELAYSTVGNMPAVGLCGTGLVDAIAALLELGIIDSSGYMENNFYFGESGVYLSSGDVRNFQLAKSAIRAGIETLLHHADVAPNEIDTFFIAGGFGSFLDILSAVKTGLIPEKLAEKAIGIGNGAGMGAAMILQSKDCLGLSVSSAAKTQALNLTGDAYFMEKYIEHMGFDA